MTHLMISTVRYAGHCTTGTSNKVWVACLAVEQHEEAHDVDLAVLPTTTEVVLLCGHGPAGAALRLEAPKRMSLQAGQSLLRKKWQEKAGKGYAAVPFAPFVPSFGTPFGLTLVLPGSPAALVPGADQAPQQGSPAFRHTAALVKSVTLTELRTLVADDLAGKPSVYALSEKANGERCLVEFDGTTLRAYNRKGHLTSAPPAGARALCQLGHPFVVDGERLIRERAGHYVVFDVLEWKGEDITTLPYRRRLTRLVRGLQGVGLLKERQLTPTIQQAQQNSTVPTLSVLLAVQGEALTQEVMTEIQTAGGEGVVIRSLDAPYHIGGFKYKFLEDVDAFVIGIEPGISAGSLTLGMVRPADGAILEVGHVRSGLTDADVERVRQMLARGQHPVFRVSYLPASTVGITLVQPTTSMAWLRTDKEARECTTDQFGPEKADLIAATMPATVAG
jgi:ATP-dependent DNA ligase